MRVVDRDRARLPVVVAVVAVLLASGFVGARLLWACDGDAGCFVVAGEAFTDPDRSGLPVLSGEGSEGYDGQFFWRLARSPDELTLEEVHGVELDSVLRVGRPVYPMLGWLVSFGGRASLADGSLIVVNLALMGALAGLIAGVAWRSGRSPWYGLVAATWPGLLFALARDLSEVTASTLLLGGTVAVSRKRPGVAAALWCAAVLAREQAVVVPFAYGVWWLLGRARTSSSRTRAMLPFALPGAAFLGWQAIAYAAVGKVPVLASGEANAAVPFGELVPALIGWVQGDAGPVGLLWAAELAVVVGLAVTSVLVGRQRWEVFATVLASLLLVSASRNVWIGPAQFRYASDVVTLAWFVVLSEVNSSRVHIRLGVRTVDVVPVLAIAQAMVAIGSMSYLVRAA